MKLWSFSLFYFVWAQLAWGGACCLGGGPRSFVQLRALQSYDLGVATSFRDVYGRHNPYGDVVRAEKLQTYTMAVGGSARLFQSLETYAILPFVFKNRSIASKMQSAGNVGDALVGARWTLYDPLFSEDWFFETKLLFAVKAPTGTTDALGSGNGIWEPSLGVQFQKDFLSWIAGLSVSYTARFARKVYSDVQRAALSVKEGDRVELLETVTVPVTRYLSISGGSSQVWDLGSSINGKGVSDSHGRYITGLLSATYFVDRFWKWTLALESTIPVARFGANEDAYRSLTLTSTYAIF